MGRCGTFRTGGSNERDLFGGCEPYFITNHTLLISRSQRSIALEGIKRPEPDLPVRDRLAFGALSTFLTGVRGLGYYEAYLTGERRGDLGDVPRLDPPE